MEKLKVLVSSLLKWILTFMLLALSLVTFAQIISRYFFKFPLVWAEEFALLMMVWITFLGSALILEKLEHISIDFLVDRFNERVQSVVFIIGYSFVLVLNMVFVIGGWEVIQTTKHSVLPGMNVSVAWLYSAVFIGGLLSSLIILGHLIRVCRNLYINRLAGGNK